MKSKVLFAFAIVYLVWGSTYLGIRVAIESIPPFLMAGARNVAAGLLLLAFARIRARRSSASAPPLSLGPDSRFALAWGPSVASGAHWRTAFIMGFLMFAMGNALLSWSETRIDSGLAALLVGAIPLWVVLLARFNPWGPQRAITLQKFLGVAVGLAGLAMLVWPQSNGSGVRMDPFALGLLTMGALAWAVGTVVSPSLPHPADKLEGSGMTMLAGGGMILVIATVSGEWRMLDLGAITPASWLALAYLVVFGSMIAYTAYAYLVHSCEASTVATYALVNPIVAVFLGWLVMDEVVTSRMLVATAVIIAGLGLTLFGGEAVGWAGRTLGRSGAVALFGLKPKSEQGAN